MPGPGEEYFNWLCAKVRRNPFPLYYDLLKIMFDAEFVWVIPRDENRAEDGKDLRREFVRTTGLEPGHEVERLGCSVLEMIIAFSERAWFQTDVPAQEWFWKIVQNLELDEHRQVQKEAIPEIESVLYNLVWRQYSYNGHGGMFPMRWPKRDQRTVEIWYQFCDYVDEEQLI